MLGKRLFGRGFAPALLALSALLAAHSAAATEATVQEKYDPQFLAAHLVQGQTTAAEVEALLGRPYRVERHTSDGVTTQSWRYVRHREGVSGMIDRGRQTMNKFRNFLPQGSRASAAATDASLAGYRAQDGMENVASLGQEAGAGRILVVEFDGDGVVKRYALTHDEG